MAPRQKTKPQMAEGNAPSRATRMRAVRRAPAVDADSGAAKARLSAADAARRIALVLVGTAGGWILCSMLGAFYEWPAALALLLDALALLGFAIALAMTYFLWRKGRGAATSSRGQE